MIVQTGIALEDPIEYLHEDKGSIVNQREVGSDTNSFARAMRRVLRQDPDVILIGESPSRSRSTTPPARTTSN